MNRFRATALALSLLGFIAPAIAGGDISVPTTPTVQAAAYSSGQAIGAASTGSNALQTVAFFPPGNYYGAILDYVSLFSKQGATTPITFYIFDTLPTATTCQDSTAFVLGGADVSKLAVVPFALTPGTSTGATPTSAQLVQVQSVQNRDTTPTKNLYVCLVVGGSYTPTSTSDLVFRLAGNVEQDP